MTEQSSATKRIIDATNLSFQYPSRRKGAPVDVIQDVSFHIDQGECLCILGPTGCGKTTLLRLLAGFERPTTGMLHLDGADIAGPARERAVVFQGDRSLYDWLTVLDNVAFGMRMAGISRSARRKRARELLETVGLSAHQQKYPPALSGGMKQRVQIARVLANEPRVLLMDEPFAALDAQTRTILQDELVRISRERSLTIFFITHDISEAILLGDRIGVMRRGPASNIANLVSVDMPRPRSRANLAFGELYEQLSDLIRGEGAVA